MPNELDHSKLLWRARRYRRHHRGGYMYFVVLGLTTIVSLMALTAMRVARTEVVITSGVSDWHEARQLALAAIENGMAVINDNPNWRQLAPNATLLPTAAGRALGHGRFFWKFVDADGDLEDNDSDPVRLIGYGYVGDTVYVESVLVRPAGGALGCLSYALQAEGRLDMRFGTITSNQTLGTNGDASASDGVSVNAAVEASGTISGATYNGSTTAGVPMRSMPDRSSALDYYLTNGVAIARNSLPAASGAYVLERMLLSPSVNPYGSTQTEGIYVLDCDGADVKVRNCRVIGTLVLLNPGSASTIEGSVAMEPAVNNFPTLLVDGDIDLLFSDADLDENSLGVNFNPPQNPYPYLEGQGSNTNTGRNDAYPSKINGLVYITGDLKVFSGAPRVLGCVVVGDRLELQSADFDVRYRDTWLNFPPPGFTDGEYMEISPGSWRRESP